MGADMNYFAILYSVIFRNAIELASFCVFCHGMLYSAFSEGLKSLYLWCPSDSTTGCILNRGYSPLGTRTNSVSTQKDSVSWLQDLQRGVMYISFPPKTFCTCAPTRSSWFASPQFPQWLALCPTWFSQYSSHEDSPVDGLAHRLLPVTFFMYGNYSAKGHGGVSSLK